MIFILIRCNQYHIRNYVEIQGLIIWERLTYFTFLYLYDCLPQRWTIFLEQYHRLLWRNLLVSGWSSRHLSFGIKLHAGGFLVSWRYGGYNGLIVLLCLFILICIRHRIWIWCCWSLFHMLVCLLRICSIQYLVLSVH